MTKFLYWLPRMLAIVYVVFFFLFAVDVFTIENSVPFLYLLVAFVIHLLPSLILLILLAIAWRGEKVGGMLFILFAAVLTILFDDMLPMSLLLFAPLLIIGLLFLFNSRRLR